MFWFFLARTLGRSVRETQETVDSREFSQWQAAYRVQPWGDEWAQTDLMCWILHAINKGPGSETLPTGHFLPRGFPAGITPGPPTFPTTEEVVDKLNLWVSMTGLPIKKVGE